jgi:aspartyl-tRNA(Asn)/glutamyl-tRNA(Gln) amidotransferase subunit A
VPDLPLTIADAAAALRSGELTSVALTEGLLGRVEATQATLGAFVTVLREPALAAAEAADAAFAAGTDAGPLQGIPLAIKDIIATEDAPTTANSRVLRPGWYDGADAPVVARLRAAGAVIAGKSTTSEFALGMPDAEKGFPVVCNPWDTACTAAGSSSGTGVAVAAGLVLGGLGTDTGGSVRSPSAVNGCTGLKVTFGRVPKSGVVPLGFTLDSVGPMARSAMDCALLLEVMAGHDPGDPYASTADVPSYPTVLTGEVDGLRIGVPVPYFFDDPAVLDEVRAAVRDAIDLLVGAGATATDTEVPRAAMAKDANSVTMAGEAFAYHARDMAERWEDYGRFTRPGLARGALHTAADYAQAQRFRAWFRREVAALFRSFDVLITPTWPVPAPLAADMTPDRYTYIPSFTAPWNLAGLPACAVPVGFSASGMPLSMQVVGRPFAEGTVLQVADAFQRRTDWHLRVPPVPALATA